jgi:hypothetical protein
VIHHKTEGIVVKKNLTELVFILDRSGSMGGLEQDTIGGFNSKLIFRSGIIGKGGNSHVRSNLG